MIVVVCSTDRLYHGNVPTLVSFGTTGGRDMRAGGVCNRGLSEGYKTRQTPSSESHSTLHDHSFLLLLRSRRSLSLSLLKATSTFITAGRSTMMMMATDESLNRCGGGGEAHSL